MKKILKNKKVVMIILVFMVLLSSIGVSVKAITDANVDKERKVSLTITKYEKANGSEESVELAGVEFTIYMVEEGTGDVETAEQYIEDHKNGLISYTQVTPANGTITFSDLNQGRYLVVETATPKNVVERIESFLIDLPMTSDDGETWEYDVTVYPKNITIYGTAILTQVGTDGRKLDGIEWILQKQNSTGDWENYETSSYITDENGQIKIENLEVGEYRLVPQNTIDGYIVDQTEPVEFVIDEDNLEYEETVENEKPLIEKYVLLDSGEYGKDIGKYTTDTVSWKTIADVPDIILKMHDYSILEEIESGLVLDADSIRVYGINESGEEIELSDDYYNIDIDGQNVVIDFATSKLGGLTNIFLTYDTTFDSWVESGEFPTKASLTYTNFITDDESTSTTDTTYYSMAEAHTGSVLIWKIDHDFNGLAGAVFKISTSKKNAENGIYIGEAVSDENGYVIFNGLKFGGDNETIAEATTYYWIVEVQSPSYEEDGEIKYYNLLKEPIEVQVNYSSGEYWESETTIVVNEKGLTLPLTGGTGSIISIILGISIILISIFIMRKKFNKHLGENIETKN